MIRHIATPVLDIAYHDYGNPRGWPVVLLHGFPYDVHAYDGVAASLIDQGARVIVPYLRGYGPTRFLSAQTPRSGQQGALGADLRDLLDALGIEKAVLGGYDWGGRAACVLAALHPERVRGLVSVNGYNIQDIATAAHPADPEKEYRLWYQYYFNSERGRAGLAANRAAFCRLLWSQWSPTWRFDDARYAQTAASFDNPDFVDVVIHSYRHRYGTVEGDPRYDRIEAALSRLPDITVPTVTLQGSDDGVNPTSRLRGFSGRHVHHVVKGAGHNLPQEAPVEFVSAVLDVHAWTD
ncbi:alpha/beta hydrolase [Robbsia sp. KACC 23696]|uniref:alpha/beta fold hydrolase n=1 Tax=Robbsia sp. KACC 23696 TaxID=3149231 RepID=UPI00325B289C